MDEFWTRDEIVYTEEPDGVLEALPVSWATMLALPLSLATGFYLVTAWKLGEQPVEALVVGLVVVFGAASWLLYWGTRDPVGDGDGWVRHWEFDAEFEEWATDQFASSLLTVDRGEVTVEWVSESSEWPGKIVYASIGDEVWDHASGRRGWDLRVSLDQSGRPTVVGHPRRWPQLGSPEHD